MRVAVFCVFFFLLEEANGRAFVLFAPFGVLLSHSPVYVRLFVQMARLRVARRRFLSSLIHLYGFARLGCSLWWDGGTARRPYFIYLMDGLGR